MSKVLIDRELLERVQERLDPHRDAVLWGDVCDTFRSAPSGTPAMPVKAYYHEAPNEYGGLNKSVGLEVRKGFADAPLVLEADALARVACLEGEIAKRDARIVGLELEVALRDQALDRHVEYGKELRAELSAIKEQEPVAYRYKERADDARSSWIFTKKLSRVPAGHQFEALYAAPVSEAKAQGVVKWPEADEIMQMAFEEGQPADDASGYCFELEEFDLFIERLMSDVARLNAAPAQQVSAPDGWKLVPVEPTLDMGWAYVDAANDASPGKRNSFNHFGYRAMLAAAPAAPAADAWIPVSERLPAVESRLDQECRVGTLSIAPLNVSAAVLVFDGEKVRSTRLEWFDGCLPLPYCITHWMPLPAAPAANSAKGVV